MTKMAIDFGHCTVRFHPNESKAQTRQFERNGIPIHTIKATGCDLPPSLRKRRGIVLSGRIRGHDGIGELPACFCQKLARTHGRIADSQCEQAIGGSLGRFDQWLERGPNCLMNQFSGGVRRWRVACDEIGLKSHTAGRKQGISCAGWNDREHVVDIGGAHQSLQQSLGRFDSTQAEVLASRSGWDFG